MRPTSADRGGDWPELNDMSGGLATRCPACHTVFRVVRDQLRVSGGWVRCGRCSEVFDAGRSLLDLDTGLPWVEPQAPEPTLPPVQPEPSAPGITTTSPPPTEPAPAATTPAPTLATSPGLPAVFSHRSANTLEQAMSREVQQPPDDPADSELEPEVWRTTPLAAPVSAPPVAPEAQPHPVPQPQPQPQPLDDPSDSLWGQRDAPEFEPTIPAPAAYQRHLPDPDEQAQATWTEASTSIGRATEAPAATSWPPLPSSPQDLEPMPALSAEDRAMAEPDFRPSFVRAAERANRWRQPRIRASLVAIALAAALGLMLQIGIAYRDLAAARAPILKPVLEAACAVLACTVGPAMAINSLVVESSSLVRGERSNQYRLLVTLRNRAGIPVALPAIDVTLTDTLGALVARKVLSATEMGSTIQSLAAGQSLTLQATLQDLAQTQNAETNATTIAGYTVEVFYP